MGENQESLDAFYTPIDDPALRDALGALGRAANIATTYGRNHPAAIQAVADMGTALDLLFRQRKQVVIGSMNGLLTIDASPTKASGTLIKSLERRLARLRITGLRISAGIAGAELASLTGLLCCNEADEFHEGIGKAGFRHVAPDKMRLQAVGEGQAVGSESALSGMGGAGVLVLEDDFPDRNAEANLSPQVSQIIAFLKGDAGIEDAGVGDELSKLASDPARLGQLIMESVAIRQTMADFSGESLGDIILGCLRRTYGGLRKQPRFRTAQGKADLQKALLLLEENLLEKMRLLGGDPDPELDRRIVMAIREMNENTRFEQAALEYLEHRKAAEAGQQALRDFVQSRGAETASELIAGTGFPSKEWRKIIIDGGRPAADAPAGQGGAGLDALTALFEQLERAMLSEQGRDGQVKDLLGQASDNLEDATVSTKGKLDSLSRHLKEEDTGTIGGQGQAMSRKELLSSIAEVAQELMQPLTAINASIEMMLQGYVGKVSNEQHDMLDLASHSAEHLEYLMRELIDIVGCPTNRGVDTRFHTTSEQVVLMNSP